MDHHVGNLPCRFEARNENLINYLILYLSEIDSEMKGANSADKEINDSGKPTA